MALDALRLRQSATASYRYRMPLSSEHLLGGVAVGIGATAIMDLWNAFLRRAFGIPSLDYCLLGRWLSHMPSGTFRHANIAAATPRGAECVVGWTAHYSIGVTFAVALVVATAGAWLARPTFILAMALGLGTIVFPFFVLQPALGLGVASSRTRNPGQARLKSIATHTVFGAGLYLCGLLVSQAFRPGG